MSLQLTSDQVTSLQDTSDQDTSVHETSLQETSLQETASHAGLVAAVSDQVAASKTGLVPPAGSGTTNTFRPRFGFGGRSTSAARAAFNSPTPAEPTGASGTKRALSMSAPLIWSGVNVGCRATIWAEAPATIGAANEVPDRRMYPGDTTWSGRSSGRVAVAGTGPIMYRPAAASSGLRKPSFVYP